MFDVWSIEHLIMGINLAFFADYTVQLLARREKISEPFRIKLRFILVLAIALAWEVFEHYVELGLLGNKVAYWFQGAEHWSNRIISDNVMVLLGCFIYTKQKNIAWFARIFSCVWLFFHIIIFPHSMYLHTL